MHYYIVYDVTTRHGTVSRDYGSLKAAISALGDIDRRSSMVASSESALTGRVTLDRFSYTLTVVEDPA